MTSLAPPSRGALVFGPWRWVDVIEPFEDYRMLLKSYSQTPRLGVL
jgi:hypothetical protein